MDLREIASVSGKGGLFKVVKPTRTGVILESIDDSKKKIIANSGQKISVLKEISIYIDGDEENLPLEEVIFRINDAHGTALSVNGKSSDDELRSFFAKVVPEYDRERVYVSDIRKIITWYSILAGNFAELISRPKAEAEPEKKKAAPATKKETETEEPKAKKPAAKKKAETAPEETPAKPKKAAAAKTKKAE